MVAGQTEAAFRNTHPHLLARDSPEDTQAGVSTTPHSYLLRMMCVMTKAKIKMVRKESDRMNM